MTDVVANLSMSLDGFIAQRDDTVEDVFRWYEGGEVEVVNPSGPTAHLTPPSAAFFRAELQRCGAFLVGRRLYDITNGWNGRPPADGPMVVVTREAPAEPPPSGGVAITFATDGIDAAVAEAKALVPEGSGKIVSVAGAALARSCLDAGLLDEVVVNLVPVVMGDGLPFFAGARGPVRLGDPEIVAAPGVTHLRYRVARA